MDINITSVVETWFEVDPKGKLPNFLYAPLRSFMSFLIRNEYVELRHTLELINEDGRQLPSTSGMVEP